MSISIAYFTNRKKPMIEWFFRSLKREFKGDYSGLQVIVIDYHADDLDRRKEFESLVVSEMGAAPKNEENPWFYHVTPKPCAVQGKFKVTKDNHFAASNSRNTAFAYCKNDFIACIDDLSVMMPGWLDQVKHAQQHRYVALGAYKKVLNLSFDVNELKFDPHPSGVDSRWGSGNDTGIVRAAGSWLFGCSFALPIEYALKVNGFDEACDLQGAEDYDFGIRLQRTGVKIFYNRNMLTLESEELHHSPGNQKFIREAVQMDFDGQKIGSDHVMLRRVSRENRMWTMGNDFNLGELRDWTLRGTPFPMPTKTHDWRTGKALAEV